MKQVYYSITRTPRRAAILCLTTLGLSYAGIPTASAQQNPGTTYEVSLGNRGARNTVSDTTLTPGPLTSTAAGIEEFFSGAGAAGVGIRPTDGAPGAGFSTLIRGLKSFRGTAEPLFILDGVILNPTTRDAAPAFQNDESDYQAVQNTLASINPNDIEKIEVLKDAASTAIYGSQGANGVIVITTKMGMKGETVRYHSNIGVSTMGHDVEMLPASDYLAMMKQANPGFDAQGGAIDWSGQAVRTAITHSHHISVSGAKDRTRHYLSLGYSGDQGILRRTDQGILNLRANFERTINKNSLIGVRGNFGHVRNNMTQGTSPLGSMSTLKAMTEAAPMRNTVKYGSQLDDTAEGWLSAYDDEASQYFVQQSLYFKAALTEGLTFDVAGGIDYRGKERMRWVGSDVWRGAEEQGRAAKSNIRAIGYNVSAHFAYDRTFGAKHHLTAMLGGTFEGSNSVNHINEGYKFFKEDLRATGIQLAENVQPSHVVRLQSQQTALFASACYTFDNRYTIHAGVRGDYTFRYDNSLDDTALYPWASAAWNIAAEPFMQHAGAISALTLRGGWGRSGRQALDPYLFNESYITGTAPDITIENGITNYYDVRWTGLNDEWNVGLEAGLFNDRIRLTANYYDSRSEDKLRYYYHKRTGDYKEIYANSARILNRGVEVGVQARLIERKEWSWDLGATFSYNHNRILATGAENDGDVFGNSTGEWFGRGQRQPQRRKRRGVLRLPESGHRTRTPPALHAALQRHPVAGGRHQVHRQGRRRQRHRKRQDRHRQSQSVVPLRALDARGVAQPEPDGNHGRSRRFRHHEPQSAQHGDLRHGQLLEPAQRQLPQGLSRRRRAAAERRRRRRRLFALRRGRLLPAVVERAGKLPVRHRQEVAPERRSGIHGEKPLRPDRLFGLFAHGGQLHLRPEPLRRGQRFLSTRPDFPPEHQSNVLIL